MNCFSFILAFLLALSYQSFVIAGTENSDNESVKLAINQFAAELYKTVQKNNKGNFVFSPTSTVTPLYILANIAGGITQQELIQAIHLQITQDNFKQEYHNMLSMLNNATGVQYNVANSIFIEEQYNTTQFFQDMSYNIFQSEVKKIDMKDSTGAAKIINDYYKEKTGGKIENIVAPDDLINAAMVMTGSTSFTGSWKYPFSSEMIDVPFHVSPSTTVSVPMMCLQTEVNHGQILDDTVLYVELPYQSDEWSMFVLIPNSLTGLDAMNERIPEVKWSELNVSTHGVNMCMPELEMKYDFDPIQDFKSLGIQKIFTNDAEFANIGGAANLQASEIVQKTILSVGRTGTQLSSGGANVHNAGHHHEADHGAHHVHQIRLDRPSMAVIFSKKAGVPVIMAQIKNPQQ